MRQRASTCNSVETEEEIQERTNRLADLSQRANVRVSEKTCDKRSHRLQVMSDLEHVRRSNESSESFTGTYYIINIQEPVLFLFLHHQQMVRSKDDLISYLNIWRNSGLRLL